MKACLTDTKSHNWAQVINQIWLSVPITAILSLGLVYVWINVLSPTDEIYISQYRLGCYAIALSCIVEQVTQSVVLVAQSFCFVKLKVVFETIYIVSRTLIFVYLVVKSPNEAINAFSVAQIASAVILCFLYYGFFFWYIDRLNVIKSGKTSGAKKTIFSDMNDFPFTSINDFFPGVMENYERVLNKDLCVLTISFGKQSVIKQVLTEGERYVMTISPVLTFSQQSMYDIVNNLGSLAARFIFRPIEDSAYFYFTQMIKRDEPVAKQDQRHISESATVLSQLCNVVTSIGLIVVVFGQSYSHTVLYLYGGNKLVANYLPVTLLRFHSFAIVLLAINGVTEGYVFATMSNKQLDRYNYVMVIFSVSFLVISYVLTNIFGPVGFILANCVNMLARIIHSLIYINKKYKSTSYKPLEGLVPDRKFIAILVISGVATKLSETFNSSLALHILIGAVFFVVTLGVWAVENKSLLRLGYDKYRRMSTKND
jgi:oligosaccharide translocation protein RFT1